MSTESRVTTGRGTSGLATVAQWLEAFFALLWLGTAFRLLGLRCLGRMLERLPVDRGIVASDPQLGRWRRIVDLAADFQPFRARCLDQCLALCWILRRRGIAAELVMGVYKFPFTAHVWLESRGEIIQWQAGLPPVLGLKVLKSMSILLRIGGDTSLNGSGD